MIYGGSTEHLGFAIVCEKMGLAVEWDCENGVGGVFKREYATDDRRYTMKKLADISNRQDVEEMEALLKYIIAFIREQNQIRDNY